jgi:hypothetical protein
VLREQPQRLVGEREIARPAAVCPAPTPVDPADELRVETDPGVEREAPAVDLAKADRPRRAGRREPRGDDGVAAEPQGAGQHARPASGQEAEWDPAGDPVHDLVVCAVAREDVDRVGRRLVLPGERRRVALTGRLVHLDVRGQHGADAFDDLGRDAARLGVDDQDRAHARQAAGDA